MWHGTQRAAWAHWRVTGDPSVALPVIGGAVRRGPGHALLRCLAELGPVAAGCAEDVRLLLGLPGGWNRVEAAHAYRRITGEAGPVAPVLLDLMEPLRTGRNSPLLRRAVHCAGALGPAGAPFLLARRSCRCSTGCSRRRAVHRSAEPPPDPRRPGTSRGGPHGPHVDRVAAP